MMWKIQLEQLFRGTRLWDYAGFAHLFVAARIGAPGVVDLPSGATIFIVERA